MQIKQIIKSPIVSIAIIITIALLIYITGKKSGDNYKANILHKSAITTGVVTGVDLKGRLGNFIEYHFAYNGNTIYSNGNARKEYASLKNFIINKQFPVIFSSANPRYNMILILPDDFEDYGVPFPDSLNWVLQYVK